MAFTDLTFIFLFLPASLILYYLFGNRMKETILLVFSLLFYACGSFEYFTLLLVSLFINMIAGRILFQRKQDNLSKLLLALGILSNTAVLGYYKYFDFAVKTSNSIFRTSFSTKNLILPLGLSFYTFKAISYLVDSYQKKMEYQGVLTSAVYLSFFGQIQSGPITRYASFQPEKRTFHIEGLSRFLLGFSKKVLLSNVLSMIVVEIFDETVQMSTSLAWLGSICYSLQLYYDFSGYSDMAIGIGLLFGYECPENFRYPYMTKSFSEFWRRWHISLGSWFRDYIYIPLGGSRVGKARLYFNLFVVWFLTGLWHGASWNFIAWGLGYFILVAFEKATDIPNRFSGVITRSVYRIFVLFVVNFQWVMFRAAGFKNGLAYLKTMLVYQTDSLADTRALFLFDDYKLFIFAAILFCLPVIPFLQKKCTNQKWTDNIYQTINGVFLIGMFIAALAFVVSGQNNPFLYANF